MTASSCDWGTVTPPGDGGDGGDGPSDPTDPGDLESYVSSSIGASGGENSAVINYSMDSNYHEDISASFEILDQSSGTVIISDVDTIPAHGSLQGEETVEFGFAQGSGQHNVELCLSITDLS